MKNCCLVIFAIVLLVCPFGQRALGQRRAPPMLVDYCELLRSPAEFDGKRVTVKATYRYGFEWQELFCFPCRDIGKTWLEIDDDLISAKSRRVLKKLPNDEGTVSAIFTGTFESSKGPFGDGGYRFRFTLDEIEQAQLVSRSGFFDFPEKVQKKICGATESP